MLEMLGMMMAVLLVQYCDDHCLQWLRVFRHLLKRELLVIGHAPDDDDDDDDIPCSLLSTPKCEKVQMCKKGFREGNGYQILAQLLIIRLHIKLIIITLFRKYCIHSPKQITHRISQSDCSKRGRKVKDNIFQSVSTLGVF